MNKPNFLVVGAAKCGTTSLYGYLKQHPDVFLPIVKECRYFSNVKDKNINPFTHREHVDIISNSEDYYSLFNDTNARILGDISPDYLYYHEESIKKIKEELGNNTKIIIMLRNPIKRSHSNYMHIIREGFDKVSFEDVLSYEEEWKKNNVWYGFYVTKPSYYYESVKAYLENFDNVKVIIFEEFVTDRKKHLVDICDFLNIDSNFEFKEPAFKNKTGLPKNKFLDNVIKNKFPLKKMIKKLIIIFLGEKFFSDKLNKIRENNLEKPLLDKKTEKKLRKLFSSDIEKLESLINKDLSIWKV